jgi:DNA-binding response OmpR family regulator
MPTVLGLEALEQLRGMELPIIMLTANEEVAVKYGLYSFGDVVPASVEDRALRSRVRGILRRRSGDPRQRVSVSSHVVAELHDPETGRLDAGRIASFLGAPLSSFAKFSDVSVAGLHKSPRSVSMQPHLIPIARSLAILTQLLPQNRRPQLYCSVNSIGVIIHSKVRIFRPVNAQTRRWRDIRH